MSLDSFSVNLVPGVANVTITTTVTVEESLGKHRAHFVCYGHAEISPHLLLVSRRMSWTTTEPDEETI